MKGAWAGLSGWRKAAAAGLGLASCALQALFDYRILTPETDDRPDEAAIDKVRQKVLHLEFRRQYPVTVSFGLVTFRTPPATVASMVFWADRKMCQAKNEGKNQARSQIIE